MKTSFMKQAAALFSHATQQTVVGGINTCLAHDATLRTHMSQHANKRLCIRWKNWSGFYKIFHDGQMAVVKQAPDQIHLTITLPDSMATDIFLGKNECSKKIRIEGEPTLAQDIHFIAQNLSFPLEEIIAKKTSPDLARLITIIQREIKKALSSYTKNFCDTFVEYAKNQGDLLVSEDDWYDFTKRSQSVFQRIEHLEKRIDELIRTMENETHEDHS